MKWEIQKHPIFVPIFLSWRCNVSFCILLYLPFLVLDIAKQPKSSWDLLAQLSGHKLNEIFTYSSLTSILCVDSETTFSPERLSFLIHELAQPVQQMPDTFACETVSPIRQPKIVTRELWMIRKKVLKRFNLAKVSTNLNSGERCPGLFPFWWSSILIWMSYSACNGKCYWN